MPAFISVNGTVCTLLDLDSLEDIAYRERLEVEYPPPGESGHAKTFVESEKRWVAAAWPRGAAS